MKQMADISSLIFHSSLIREITERQEIITRDNERRRKSIRGILRRTERKDVQVNENELTGLLESLRRMGSDDLNVEVKESATTLSRDVWETVSAFANTAGGIIVLGVSERAGFVPVENFETEKVLNQFVAGMGDAGGRGKLANPPKYTIERVELQGTVVLVITIEELDPSSKPCYVIERGAQGGSYKRIDDKDVPLSSTEVLSLSSYERASPSDRDAVPGAVAGDLDEALVDRTIERAFSLTPRAMRGAPDKKTKLERLNFLDSQGNVTKAGLLAAGAYPQQFYPKLFIDVAVYAGTQKGAAGSLRFMDRTICEGTLGEMISDAVAAVAKNLRRTSMIKGVSRVDSLEIPEEVLREAIANAVIHREYGDRFCGQSIAVDVFDDRIEVTNPGGLYGGKTRENLFDGSSRCRNATLVKLMSIVPLPDGAGSPAEGNGSGIPMMFDAMRAHGLSEPLFCPGFDRFKVVLYRSKVEQVDHGGDLIMAALKRYDELGTRELAECTGLTVSQVRVRVNALIAQGELEPTASATSRNRKYRLSERVG